MGRSYHAGLPIASAARLTCELAGQLRAELPPEFPRTTATPRMTQPLLHLRHVVAKQQHDLRMCLGHAHRQ